MVKVGHMVEMLAESFPYMNKFCRQCEYTNELSHLECPCEMNPFEQDGCTRDDYVDRLYEAAERFSDLAAAV